LGGGYLLWNAILDSRDAVRAASCANHFLQFGPGLRYAREKSPDFILPSTDDTRIALRAIVKQGRPSITESELQSWIDWNPCTDAFERDGSYGYVYVGDGIRLADVQNKGILVLFCGGECHRRSREHCHAWAVRSGDDMPCVGSNADMVSLIQEAVRRGETGEIPYSARAMNVLRAELAKRLK
jgi:hypothetical protein